MVKLEGDEAVAAVRDNHVMELEAQGFTPENVRDLAKCLETNRTLLMLDLSDNWIGAEGAKAVADSLKVNTTLTSLSLEGDWIGDEGAKAIADALKVNTALTSLVLQRNLIGAEGVKAIADALKMNTTLTSLNLFGNIIRGNGIKAVADALKVNTTLTSLDFQFLSYGPDGAKAIADAFKKNTTLTSLNLFVHGIGAKGAKAMADALKVNTALTSLNLSDISLSEGTKEVAEALKVNTTLTSLDLFIPSFSSEGVKEVAEALKVNTTLTSLNLRDNYTSVEGAEALACALILQWEANRYISLRELAVMNGSSALRANGPLATIPPEVLQKGLDDVHEYLLSLEPGDVEARQRLKVLVVGYVGTGKTTLLDVLSPLSSHAFVIIKTLISTKAVPCTVTLRSSLLSVTGQYSRAIRLNSDHWTMMTMQSNDDLRLTFAPKPPSAESLLTLQFPTQTALAEFRERAGHILHNCATHGIDVRPLVLADQSDVELTAWDFAGQHDYYGQHHYFLDDRAIYVLCWDISKHIEAAEEELRFWMRALKARLTRHADTRASLVVVGTHADKAVPGDRAARINEIAGVLQFPVNGYFEVSNLPSFAGIAALTKHLAAEASRLTTREIVPVKWRHIEMAISVLAREHSAFPMVDLATVQARVKVLTNTDVSIDIVRASLVNMAAWGRIVYLTHTKRLANVVVLSPTFLTQKRLGMLFSPPVQRCYMKNGRLRLSDLGHVWKDHQSAKYRDELLELLLYFDLCFRVHEDGIDWLVFPSQISTDEPSDLAKTWPPKKSTQNEMARVFAFDVLPPELVSRLLSRIGHDVHGKLLWRYGAILRGKNNTTLGLLRADATPNASAGRLYIRVRSAQSSHRDALALLARLVQEVYECMKSYKGVTVTEELLCGCDHGNGLTPLQLIADAFAEQHADIFCAHNNAYRTRELLEGAGLIEPSTVDKPIIAGDVNDDFVRVLMARLDTLESTLRAVVVGVDRCNYPALFMLTPAVKPSAWLDKLVDRAQRTLFDKFQLHALCEFHLGNERPLCHVPQSSKAQEIKDLRNREVIEALGTTLKITSYVLQAVQIGVRIAGIPLPDVASALSGLVDMACQANDGVGMLRQGLDKLQRGATNTHVPMDRDLKPQRLQGNALGDVVALFGHNLNGLVESAGLHRASVLRGGCPTGPAGACLWVCADHRSLIEQWNNDTQMDVDTYVHRGQEITETQWVSFGN